MAGIWVTPPHLLRDGRWDEIRALADALFRVLETVKAHPGCSTADGLTL